MAVPLVPARSAAGTAAETPTSQSPTMAVTITVPTNAPAASLEASGSRPAAWRWMPTR